MKRVAETIVPRSLTPEQNGNCLAARRALKSQLKIEPDFFF